MGLRMRDRMELLAELPDRLGADVHWEAVPEERVVVGHLFPAAAKDTSLPAGSGGLSLCGVHPETVPPPSGRARPRRVLRRDRRRRQTFATMSFPSGLARPWLRVRRASPTLEGDRRWQNSCSCSVAAVSCKRACRPPSSALTSRSGRAGAASSPGRATTKTAGSPCRTAERWCAARRRR